MPQVMLYRITYYTLYKLKIHKIDALSSLNYLQQKIKKENTIRVITKCFLFYFMK